MNEKVEEKDSGISDTKPADQDPPPAVSENDTDAEDENMDHHEEDFENDMDHQEEDFDDAPITMTTPDGRSSGEGDGDDGDDMMQEMMGGPPPGLIQALMADMMQG